MSGPPPDYVDVSERIRMFYERFPEGSLQTGPPELLHVGDKTFVTVQARAYRTADDPCPGYGSAWEPVPGPTPFTRDSELQNAETSAWGRAIVALGFETKHIASANEVRNRSGETKTDFVAPEPASKKAPGKGQFDTLKLQLKLLDEAFPEHPGEGRTWADVAKEHVGKPATELSMAEMNGLLEWLEDQFREAASAEAVPFG